MGQGHFSFQLVDKIWDENFSAVSRSIFHADSKSAGISALAVRGNSEKGEIIKDMQFAKFLLLLIV